MIEILNVGKPADWHQSSAPSTTHTAFDSSPPSAEVDSVELTSFAKALLEATGGSSLRAAKVNAIRSEIQEGIFDTPERVQGTVARLIDVLW
jgi:anti-sigma28 factor (negative regulator of flagellin synthesis)